MNRTMTPETRSIVERWIANMESGKFQRARSSLRSKHQKNGRCCIGVLCETLGLEHRGDTSYQAPDAPESTLLSSGSYSTGVGRWSNVLEFAGIPRSGPHTSTLVNINDSPHTRGYARQIAYIKENIL